MIEFQPLRGWRYNSERIEMTEVLAPPYDIISNQKQSVLYERSPFNCIRLILNQITESDTPENNRYTRARDSFNSWSREGILIQEESPVYYLYKQSFKDLSNGQIRDRVAFIGRLKLDDFANGNVIPHEKTLKKPKEDRKQLLKTAGAVFSPIFGLYEDSEKELQSCFSEGMRQPPLFEVRDDEAITHSLWAVDKPDLVEKVRRLFKNKKIYIADGHHRYQTALDYANERRKKLNSEQLSGADFTLMALVEFHDPGLALYPTHRLLSLAQSAEVVQKTLSDFFSIESIAYEALEKKIDEPQGHETAFGIAGKGFSFWLTLKEASAYLSKMPKGKPKAWYRLDVNLVNYLILEELWKIPENQREEILSYTHEKKDVANALKQEKCGTAFLLKAPRVEILKEMGDANELLPQKSTYFYPKLASGLVFYRHEMKHEAVPFPKVSG